MGDDYLYDSGYTFGDFGEDPYDSSLGSSSSSSSPVCITGSVANWAKGLSILAVFMTLTILVLTWVVSGQSNDLGSHAGKALTAAAITAILLTIVNLSISVHLWWNRGIISKGKEMYQHRKWDQEYEREKKARKSDIEMQNINYGGMSLE